MGLPPKERRDRFAPTLEQGGAKSQSTHFDQHENMPTKQGETRTHRPRYGQNKAPTNRFPAFGGKMSRITTLHQLQWLTEILRSLRLPQDDAPRRLPPKAPTRLPPTGRGYMEGTLRKKGRASAGKRSALPRGTGFRDLDFRKASRGRNRLRPRADCSSCTPRCSCLCPAAGHCFAQRESIRNDRNPVC